MPGLVRIPCMTPLDQLAQPNEGPHDLDAHFRGGFAAEDVGRLNGAVLGEGAGQILDVLAALQGRILRP